MLPGIRCKSEKGTQITTEQEEMLDQRDYFYLDTFNFQTRTYKYLCGWE